MNTYFFISLASHCAIWIDKLVCSSSSVFWTCLSLCDSQQLLILFQPSDSQLTSGIPPLTFPQSRFWKSLNELYCNSHLMLSSRLPSIDVCVLSLCDNLRTAFSETLGPRFVMPCFMQLFPCLVSVSIRMFVPFLPLLVAVRFHPTWSLSLRQQENKSIEKSLITDTWVFLFRCLCNVWILL